MRTRWFSRCWAREAKRPCDGPDWYMRDRKWRKGGEKRWCLVRSRAAFGVLSGRCSLPLFTVGASEPPGLQQINKLADDKQNANFCRVAPSAHGASNSRPEMSQGLMYSAEFSGLPQLR